MISANEAMRRTDAIIKENISQRLARYEDIFRTVINNELNMIEEQICEKIQQGAYALYGYSIHHIYEVGGFSIPGFKVMEAIEYELHKEGYSFTINFDSNPDLFCGLDIHWN